MGSVGGSIVEKKRCIYLFVFYYLHTFAAVIVLYSYFCEFSLLYRGDLLYRGGIKRLYPYWLQCFPDVLHNWERRDCIPFFEDMNLKLKSYHDRYRLLE